MDRETRNTMIRQAAHLLQLAARTPLTQWTAAHDDALLMARNFLQQAFGEEKAPVGDRGERGVRVTTKRRAG